MKRLTVMLAAAAVAASPLAVDLANAQGRGGGRDDARAERWRGGEERRWPRFEERAGRDRFEDRRRREDRRLFSPPPEYGDVPRGGPRMLRPGGYLPPGYRGGMVQDFQRYRLRPPPHGYAWVRAGNAFLLVSLVDGQIFDVIVD